MQALSYNAKCNTNRDKCRFSVIKLWLILYKTLFSIYQGLQCNLVTTCNCIITSPYSTQAHPTVLDRFDNIITTKTFSKFAQTRYEVPQQAP